MATPCGCEDGDYRPECWNCTSGTPGADCPPGTTGNPNTGECIPTGGGTTGGTGSGCPGGAAPQPNGECYPPRTDWSTGGGGGGGGAGAYNDDNWPSYFGPMRPSFNFGPAPMFNAPQFTAPTMGEAENEPGYAFARKEGLGALESSAAARGLARTGGTYKGLVAWGNKFAEQNYGNVFNRALQAFDRLYTGKLDEYKPRLHEWSTNASATQRAGELEFDRWWQRYLSEVDRYKYGHPSAQDLLNNELGWANTELGNV